MTSDQDYAAFLDKANQDTGSDQAAVQSESGFAALKTVNTSVPAQIQQLDAYYSSEADEPFEAVSLKHDGKDLNATGFSKLIGHDGDVEEKDMQRFNSSGRYDGVIKAVSDASSGEIKVFRVSHAKSRCEYYVVALDEHGNVVGVKARAVET